jgi:hypothetical protein
MERPPSLAEILADETGRIRPEVADLLMEPNPERPRPNPRPQPRPPVQRQPFRLRWVVIGLIVLIIYLLIPQCPKRATPVLQNPESTVVPERIAITPPITPPRPVEKKQEGQTIKNGRVLGDNVNIREQAGLQFPVIKMVHQNEIVTVLSFQDGWYKIRLEDQKSGYLFGAFLLPLNFDSFPYRAGVTRDQTRVLIKIEENRIYYQLISANGQSSLIKKDDVSFHP